LYGDLSEDIVDVICNVIRDMPKPL
jgi:hypothetical protein